MFQVQTNLLRGEIFVVSKLISTLVICVLLYIVQFDLLANVIISSWDLNDKHNCNQFIQWLMPSEGGYLEADGPVEKTWRIKQEDIGRAVDILSARNQHDVILPGLHLLPDCFL